MAEHVWSVLCSKSVIDTETRQVSLFDTLETLTIKLGEPLPAEGGLIPFRTDVVSLWRRSDPAQPEKTMCKCEIVGPRGDTIIVTVEMEVDLSKERRFRSTFRTEVFPIRGSGTYRFNVSQKISAAWVLAASLPLEVTVIEAEKPLASRGDSKKRSAGKKNRRS
jgi:hypothetical protein